MQTDTIVIESGRSETNYWRDLWRYRELFYILSWRDLKVRYKQTLIGLLWSVLRPLLTMLIFTFFSKAAKLPVPNTIPTAVFIFAGLLPWQFFANALSESSNSLIGNERLISKVYFPRMIIPAASVITSLVDFFISFILFILLIAWYSYMPSWKMVFLPLFILMAFIASFGAGLWITALNVKYRDFKYVVPFIVQLGLYISPVIFQSSLVPGEYQLLYHLNPIAGVIDGFRWCVFDDSISIRWDAMLVSAAVTMFFLFIGIRTFRKMERTFADLI
jgi:lipopolysaccharide transport system permease protein